ncbi:hypothetical protein ACE1TH_11390 [Shouchella sp. JSM 1781072]|uniref:hypothetical protein n=1 Tax=Shouchella sp. JSM 1781072 TaxID=3344581 RepID=UPI0035C2535E
MDKQALKKLSQNRTVPIYDCDYHQFDEHLEFYTALGFELIYYQKAPYRYASVFKDQLNN